MPEGPEVRYLADLLSKNFKNHQLASITILSGRYTKRHPDNLKTLNAALPSKITHIENKGKFLYINLQNGFSIWFTLGLTGTFYLNCAGKAKDERGIEVDKFCRMRLDTFNTSISNSTPFFFSDMRNFGTMTIHLPKTSEALLKKKLQTLGDDPLTATTASEKTEQRKTFIKKVQSQRNQKKPIGTLLLEQKILSGVGNYVRAIALYRAKISPHRTLQTLTPQDLTSIYNEIYKVERASYKKQTLSGLHTYPLTVYRKTKDPKGNPIQSDELPKGRQIYWSPKIQK